MNKWDNLFESAEDDDDEDVLIFSDIFDNKKKIKVSVINKDNPNIVEDIETGQVYEIEEPIMKVFKLKGTNYKRDTREFNKRKVTPRPPSVFSKLNIIPEKVVSGVEKKKEGQTYFA